MIPRILEFENGRLRVTEFAFMQPELRAIMDKHKGGDEPYLAYVHCMTALDSPYSNISEEEKEEVIVYDIINTIGDFDNTDELIVPAIEKLNKLYETKTMRYHRALGISIDKMSDYLIDQPIVAGKEGNLSEIIRIHKEGGATIRSYKDIGRQVDEELKDQFRGDQEMGEY